MEGFARMGLVGSNRTISLKVLGLLIFALGTGWVGVRAASQKQASHAREQELRKRVEEYYSLLQLGRFTQAEDYVDVDSKDSFRKIPKSPFLGFQVESAKLTPDGKSGAIIVKVHSFLPGLSTKPVDMPYLTHWRLVNGSWFLTLPKDMPVSPLTALMDKTAQPARARPEDLKFKGHRYNYAKMDQGQKKVARFPFTNISDHDVTITTVITGTPMLTVEDFKKQYKPGESGELAIDFVPVGFDHDYAQTVVVKTDPGGLLSYLLVTAYVIPTASQLPKTSGKNQPAKTPHPRTRNRPKTATQSQ